MAKRTYVKRILVAALLIGSAFLSKDTFAQTTSQAQQQAVSEAYMDQAIQTTRANSNSQAVVYDSRSNTTTSANTGSAVRTTFSDAAVCSAGQVLANLVTSLVTSAVQSVTGAVDNLTSVPINVQGQALYNSNVQTNAEVGMTTGLFGISALTAPSWNSIAYCIVNAMIEYVANSTIAWVQGGFEGNPSFVDNPEQFFKDLANVEAGAFLQSLAYGTLGVNICEPFRAQIVLTIARSHLATQGAYGGAGGYSQGGYGSKGGAGGVYGYGYGGCSLDDIKGNMQGFLNGDFQKGGWNSWFQITQVDSNNPFSTYFNLQAQLNGAINKKQTLATQELNWGQGFLSFRKCDSKVPENQRNNCPITTPGNVIQGQLEKTLGLAKDRLVLAEKFDQVVAAVVNQLINTALDKVLDSKSSNQAYYRSSNANTNDSRSNTQSTTRN